MFAAALLMFADARPGLLGPARAVLSDASVPFYWLSSLPGRMAGWVAEVFASRDTLVAENRALRAEALVLRATVALMEAEPVTLEDGVGDSEPFTVAEDDGLCE